MLLLAVFALIIAVVIIALVAVHAPANGITTASISVPYTHAFLSGILSISNNSPAAFGANYTIVSSMNVDSRTVVTEINVSMERYGNDSGLQFAISTPSKSQAPTLTRSFVRSGANYFYCQTVIGTSRCYRINASALGYAASFGSVLYNASRSVNFSVVNNSTAVFEGHACTIVSGEYAFLGSGVNVTACVSRQLGVIYNFTIRSSVRHTVIVGSLTSMRTLGSASAVSILLQNATLSKLPQGASSEYLGTYAYFLNNFNPLYLAALLPTPIGSASNTVPS